MTLLWILASTLFVSLLSFIGLVIFAIKEKILEKILLVLVSLSAGVLMGSAFLHLLPEAMGSGSYAAGSNAYDAFLYVLFGFCAFFLVEKALHWQHCHERHCKVHTFAYMNLVGDGVHNFMDGLIIAASFVTNIPLGITTTLAVALHEIPQEISDFGVLIYGGFKKTKALLFNFISALIAVLGGVTGFYASGYMSITAYITPLAAGGFIYIAATDLIPEIRKEKNIWKSFAYFGVFFMGIMLMHLLREN